MLLVDIIIKNVVKFGFLPTKYNVEGAGNVVC